MGFDAKVRSLVSTTTLMRRLDPKMCAPNRSTAASQMDKTMVISNAKGNLKKQLFDLPDEQRRIECR